MAVGVGVDVGVGVGVGLMSVPQPTNTTMSAGSSSGMALSFTQPYYPKRLRNGSTEVTAWLHSDGIVGGSMCHLPCLRTSPVFP